MNTHDAWTKPYYGITHLGNLRDERRVTVADYGHFALLSRYIRGHGLLSQTSHASVDVAKQVGARWIAEWIAQLEARPGEEFAPLCPAHPEHGPMEKRPQEGQTREQRFCGDWWDCRKPGCGSAMLFPSPEWIAPLEARRGNLKNPEEN